MWTFNVSSASMSLIHTHCITDGFDMLILDDADVDKDVCITNGGVGL